MEKLKNLFDYATSELSQDAFLCWLLENYNCENPVVSRAALDLLGKMTDLDCSKPGAVTELKTDRQETENYPNPEPKKDEKKSIHCVFDIIVTFRYREEKHMLLIEDKIFSSPSNKQIGFYPQAFKKYAERHCIPKDNLYRVIYKTDIDLYGYKEKSPGWNKSFYLDNIYSFFEKQQHSGCLIFDQYRKHICELHEKTTKLPDKPMAEWKDLILFRTYIQQKILPFVNSNYGDVLEASPSGWISYSAIWIERKDNDNITKDKKVRFSLEISFWRHTPSARITLRGGKMEVKNKDLFASKKFREWAESNLIRGSKGFRVYRRDYCVGHNKKEFLSYESGIEKVTQDCKELIEDFAKMCREMNKELPQHPDWRIFLTEREK